MSRNDREGRHQGCANGQHKRTRYDARTIGWKAKEKRRMVRAAKTAYFDRKKVHNFVSDDIDGFCAYVRVRYARSCARLVGLSAGAVEQLPQLASKDSTPAEYIAFAFWSKCVRGCQAAFILAERGMVADAQASLRGAVETLFHAVALVRKPELLDRFCISMMTQRRKSRSNRCYKRISTLH